MKTLLLLLHTAIATPAWGQSQGYTNRICVDILTNFLDADYTGPVTAGGFWVQNGPRPARGVEIRVTDDIGPTIYNVGNDGCITVGTTQTNPLHAFFTVQAASRAVVNGIDIKATNGASHTHPACQAIPNTDDCPGVAQVVTFQVAYAASDTTLTVSNGDQRWNLLAIAMWAMHRNTFHLGTFSSRGCCLDDTAPSFDQLDGTCVNDPADQYQNEWSQYQSATVIEMHSNGQGDSRRTWLVGNDEFEVPAVGVTSPFRFQIAHELGHVIVEKRMGKFTRTDVTAPLDECLGDYNAFNFSHPAGDHQPPGEDVNDVDTSDTAGGGVKGAFTKEYQSLAAREGWATFFAVWLFNRRTGSDGQMDWWTIHDLDRDGTLDNNYDADTSDTDPSSPSESAMGDGIVEMGTHPISVTPWGNAPLAQYARGHDWLELLVSASDPLSCTGSLGNRGTEYDWARFFWDMTLTGAGDVRPEILADLYVDMCPTNWVFAGDPDPVQPPLPWPIVRLEQSAIHQGPAVETEWSARKVWGQDH